MSERAEQVERLKKRLQPAQIAAAGALFADFINGAPIPWSTILKLVEGVNVVEDARTAALKVLGLGPEASEFEIKVRYRRLAKEFHPDITKDNGERMKRLNLAMEALGI